jgi:trigger factor
LKTEVERLPEGRVALHVEVDPPRVEQALQDAYRHLVRTLTLPGFRRGKAPRSIVERMLGRERLWRDAVDPLVQESFQQAAEERGLTPVEPPEVDFEAIPAAGEPFRFKAVFAVKPEVTLGDYRSIRIPRQVEPVTDADVERALEELRASRARWIPVEDEPAADGMLVTLDVTGSVDGQPVPPEQGVSGVLGEDGLRPAIADAVRGLRPGESRSATVSFPADDGDAQLAGKTGHFTVTLVECKRRQLPELDDAFAREVSEGSTTLEELRAEVQKTLARVAASRADDAVASAARRRAVEQASVDIPPVMIERRLDAALRDLERQLAEAGTTLAAHLEQQGRTVEDLRREMRPEAEHQVKTQLVLEAIADREGLEPSADEVRRQIEDMASQYGRSAGQVRRLLQRPENMADVRADLRLAKAARFLRDLAVAGAEAETEVSPAEVRDAGEMQSDPAPGPAQDEPRGATAGRADRSGRPAGGAEARGAPATAQAPAAETGSEPEDRAEARA